MSRVTINDVAARAGVSIKTVSRVMNREPNVRESTRKRVVKAAAALNYRPSPAARGLAGNRTYFLAMLYDNPSPSYLANIQEGILETCQANAYGMVPQPVDTEAAGLVGGVEEFIAQSRVDGLILTPPVCDHPALMEHLKERDLPFVSVSPPAPEGGLTVMIDDRRAAREMTAYLLSLGHRRIGFVKGHPAHGAGRRRFDGYQDALKEAGIGFEPGLARQGYFSFESGVKAGQALLALNEPPTAIFAGNDDMAAGVMHVALNLGLRIPLDLSVAGFDDTPLSRQIWPALTTVRQPIQDMGRRAAKTLLDKLRTVPAPELVELPFELKVRESSGPAVKSRSER
ncbi:MAG: LacI family DNA-binding transcriptional regulator [Sphingomonadales bacterium]